MSSAYTSKTGTIWQCKIESFELIFLILDGFTEDMASSLMSEKRKGRSLTRHVMVPFRNYFDLSNGEIAHFSRDSLINKLARRFK